VYRIIDDVIISLLLYIFISFVFVYNFVPYVEAQSRLYAGYAYYGFGSYGIWGVKGDILSSKIYNVPPNGFGAEWVTVILKYKPFYWIQTGYVTRNVCYVFIFCWIERNYYIEVNDGYGHRVWYYSGPRIGSVHRYQIINMNAYSDPLNPIDPHYWEILIDPQNELIRKTVYVYPYYEGVDMRAMIELTDNGIDVELAHFSSLQRYLAGWRLWDRVGLIQVDPPFVLERVSYYEFYAWTK